MLVLDNSSPQRRRDRRGNAEKEREKRRLLWLNLRILIEVIGQAANAAIFEHFDTEVENQVIALVKSFTFISLRLLFLLLSLPHSSSLCVSSAVSAPLR
jgi:hypothetical protein